MDARYSIRKNQLLDECQVAPEIFEQVMPRLHTFMAPFVDTFQGQALSHHAKTSVSGLLSDVARKNVESIAYHVGQNRLGLQGFIGWADWDDAPLRKTLLDQVGTQLGQGDGVLVFDPSAFPKSGRESVGVARQWCGRLGKVDNCQVAIYLGYVSRKGHTLVDLRLYLPKEWTQDKARLHKAGVPQARRGYRTRHQLALEMLEHNGASLPHGWIAGDDEMGRPYWFRRRLAAVGERSMLAVPSNTMMRDLETPAPDYSGKGRPPKRPWQSVKTWAESLGTAAWRRVDVRDGAKGPLVVDVVKRRVVSRTHRRQTRSRRPSLRSWPGWPKPNIASKNVCSEARAKRAWPTMRCAIGRAGSIIKRFRSWQHGFWSKKPSGGKKWTPAMTLPQIRQGIAMILHEAYQCDTRAHLLDACQKRLRRNELARFYHWKQRNLLPPLNLHKRQF